MPVIINAETKWGQELAKWNTPKNQGGHRPDKFEPFPRMLYRANKVPGAGHYSTGEANDLLFNRDQGAMAAFNQRCQLVVQDERELQRARESGWRESPKEAIEFAEGRDKDIADEAARRHFADRNMSEAAKAEAKAADDGTAEHVPEVPQKRRGRKPRAA